MRRVTLYLVGFAVVLPIAFYSIYLTSRVDPATAGSSVAEDITKRCNNIPFLTAVLANDDAERRIQAAEFLGCIDDPNAYRALVKVLLDDPDREVRKTVIEVLARRGDRKAIHTLVSCLSLSEHFGEDRDALVEALSEIGPPARSLLHEYLASSDRLERRAAIKGLGLLKDATAVKPLAEILHDPGEDIGLRFGAALGLGYIGSPEAVEPLMKALQSDVGSVHTTAAIALGNLGRPEAIAPLLDILANSDPGTRPLAVDALVCIGPPSVAPLLSRLNEASSPPERADVITALGRLGDRRAADSLIEILKDRSEEVTVRACAADGLGQMRIEEAVEPFLAILGAKDEDVLLRGHVAAALRIAGAEVKEPLLTVISDPNESVALRRVCVGTLTDIGGSDVADSLLRAAGTTEDFRVLDCANALEANFQHFYDSGLMVMLYADPQLDKWAPISEHILSQGKTSPNFLLDALEDRSAENRARAALYLGLLREPGAVPSLCKMSSHEEALVRNTAIWALGACRETCSKY